MRPPAVARLAHARRAPATRAGAPLLLMALAACGDARAADPRAEGVAGEPPAVPVRVAPAELVRSAEEVRAGGVVEARATAELAFQVGGKLVAVPVDEGARVARGALLAAVDPTEYRLALRQAELQLARAEDELGRAEQLRGAGSIAANDYDRLASGARQAAVARDLAAKRLADTRLVAPFAGVVARKAAEAGATAAVGAPVFTLVDLDLVHVRAAVPEGDVGRLRAGQPARVALEALAGTPAESARGRVATVGVAADPASRTYPVKVAVPNDRRLLRAGMVATVAVATGAARSAVAVPAAAVARDADGATLVYVLDRAAGRARARRVEVGAPVGILSGNPPDGSLGGSVGGGLVAVARGLAAGEPVVVAGQERLRDGARVAVVGVRP